MKSRSKEAIRNKIIKYAGIVWNTKRVDDIHPLVHLMIEEVCDELYLMDNKLHDIDATILEKLVQNIIPTNFSYVRAGSAIAQIRPAHHKFHLDRKTEFFIKETPDNLLRKHLGKVVLSPVTDIHLNNLGISHLFYNRKLWETDQLGNRKPAGQFDASYFGNKLWLLMDNPMGIKQVKDLYFYINFPHLSDSHDYYQNLCRVKWTSAGTVLRMEEGLPLMAKSAPGKMESDVLSYYKIHYRTVKGTWLLEDNSSRGVPDEPASILGQEMTASLPGGYWICIEFPAHFRAEDLEKIQILLNTFPVLNRRYVDLRQDARTFTGVMALPSDQGEEFLELEGIEDANKNSYVPEDTANKSGQGTYSLEPVKKKDIHDTRLHDYLELFLDVLERERTAFPGVDIDKITAVQHAVTALRENAGEKTDSNILNEHAEVARLSVNLKEDTHALHIGYWTTLGETVNNLPAGTGLMSNQIAALNKSEATLITSITGGRLFYDPESLKAINRFYMTSKGRILTKHDILSFCRIEVGKYAGEIDAVRCGKISPRPGEGIVNAMEIRITPKEQYRDYFKQKEVLRWLKIRLEERSPIHYNYFITIIES